MFAIGITLKNRKINNTEDENKHVHKLYLQRGFKIMRTHAYIKFEPLHAEVANIVISLNCASKKEHVTGIELFRQTIKYCVRSAQAATTLKQIPKLMIIHLVTSVIFCRNDFPLSKTGVGLS